MKYSATPLVSIVIPNYNHARFLGRALQSVLNQTYTNWEAIVIDNYSTDNTDEVMASHTDQRIVYLKVQNNGVIAVSRNAGIRAAKGEWIAFLDSDDWWTADKLQVCFDCIYDKVDFVYHDLQIVNDQTRYFQSKTIKSWQVKTPVLTDLMVRGSAIATSSVVVKKKLLKQLKGMNESSDMVGAEDYNTWLRIAQITERFRYLPKRLGFYQLHKQGISSQKDMSVPAMHAVDEFIDLLSQQQKNKLKAHLKYSKGRYEYLAGNTFNAKKNLLFSLRYGKSTIKLKSVFMLIGMLKMSYLSNKHW